MSYMSQVSCISYIYTHTYSVWLDTCKHADVRSTTKCIEAQELCVGTWEDWMPNAEGVRHTEISKKPDRSGLRRGGMTTNDIELHQGEPPTGRHREIQLWDLNHLVQPQFCRNSSNIACVTLQSFNAWVSWQFNWLVFVRDCKMSLFRSSSDIPIHQAVAIIACMSAVRP